MNCIQNAQSKGVLFVEAKCIQKPIIVLFINPTTMKTPIASFSKNAFRKLGHYVYRLVDPRTGNTFYVGKGQKNRVFAHVNEALSNYNDVNYLEKDEDDYSAKIKQIREIKNAGLEVIMIIHRWGMTRDEAFEVESALIDAYSTTLTNIVSGHHSDRGVMNVESLERKFKLRVFNDKLASRKEYLIIKIRQDVLDSNMSDIYITARKAWVIDKNKAKSYKYILVSCEGEVIAIYKNVKWSTCLSIPNRCEFEADEVDAKLDKKIIKRYLHKLIPIRYREKGASNPIRYQS